MRARFGLVGTFVLATACGSGVTAPSQTSTPPSDHADATSVQAATLFTIAESPTIEQEDAGQGSTSDNYAGQSITIPGVGSYNNLRFSWDGYSFVSPTEHSVRGPIALGDLFLLAQEYVGLPGSLGTSTPGFIAQAQRADQGQYIFAPSVTVKGGTKYWFYTYYPPGSADFRPISGFSEDTYPGGDGYMAPELKGFNPLPFRKLPASKRVTSWGPPIVYYTPPPGTYVDINFKLMGARAGP